MFFPSQETSRELRRKSRVLRNASLRENAVEHWNPYQFISMYSTGYGVSDWTLRSRRSTLICIENNYPDTTDDGGIESLIGVPLKEKFRPISWTRLIETDDRLSCPG